MKTKIRTYYDDSYIDPGVTFLDPETGEKQLSLTVQSEADECDINKIVERFAKTGILPSNTRGEGLFFDVADAPTFQEAIHIVKTAEETFAQLPSNVRDYFANNPVNFLTEFEKGNKELFERLGLTEASPASSDTNSKAGEEGKAE